MSTLSSTSSLSDIQAAYDNNGSYLEDNSVAKARAFVTACLLLLRRLPRTAGQGGGSITMNPDLIRAELGEARRWLASNSDNTTATTGSVKFLSIEGLR